MTNTYKELAGCSPDDASDIGIRLKILAGEVSRLYKQLDTLETQLFPHTSSNEYLDKHGAMRGLTRKPATPSFGMLRFSRESVATADLPIPKGTYVSTNTTPNYFFITTAAGVLPAGANRVELSAQCDTAGSEGNIATGMVSILVSNAPGVSAVTNLSPFTGGREAETDDSFRNRIVESYIRLSNGTNSAYYHDIASSHAGVSFAKVLPRHRGRGTVDVIIHGSSTAETEKEIIRQLEKIYRESKEIGVDVAVKSAKKNLMPIGLELQVKDNYTFDLVGESAQSAISNYMNQLGIGEPLLLTHLGKEILGVDGVLNYRFQSPPSDSFPLVGDIIRPSTIDILPWGTAYGV